MAEATTLAKVKSMLGITGSYQDAAIQCYIDEVKQYLIDGGVQQNVVDAPTSTGIIARGVSDLWNYGAGEGKLSTYFKERAIQLSKKTILLYSVKSMVYPCSIIARRDGKNTLRFIFFMYGDTEQASDITVHMVPKSLNATFTKKDLKNLVRGGAIDGNNVYSVAIKKMVPNYDGGISFSVVMDNLGDNLANKYAYYARLGYVINGELTYCRDISIAKLDVNGVIKDYNLPDE